MGCATSSPAAPAAAPTVAGRGLGAPPSPQSQAEAAMLASELQSAELEFDQAVAEERERHGDELALAQARLERHRSDAAHRAMSQDAEYIAEVESLQIEIEALELSHSEVELQLSAAQAEVEALQLQLKLGERVALEEEGAKEKEKAEAEARGAKAMAGAAAWAGALQRRLAEKRQKTTPGTLAASSVAAADPSDDTSPMVKAMAGAAAWAGALQRRLAEKRERMAALVVNQGATENQGAAETPAIKQGGTETPEQGAAETPNQGAAETPAINQEAAETHDETPAAPSVAAAEPSDDSSTFVTPPVVTSLAARLSASTQASATAVTELQAEAQARAAKIKADVAAWGVKVMAMVAAWASQLHAPDNTKPIAGAGSDAAASKLVVVDDAPFAEGPAAAQPYTPNTPNQRRHPRKNLAKNLFGSTKGSEHKDRETTGAGETGAEEEEEREESELVAMRLPTSFRPITAELMNDEVPEVD